jgi:hypothetical protein
LNRIITGDDTWIHHCDPEVNASLCSGSTQSPSSKKFKIAISRKGYANSVLGHLDPILKHYQERGNLVRSVRCDMLRKERKSAIRIKRRGRLSQQHDNACPHSAAHTRESTQELKF